MQKKNPPVHLLLLDPSQNEAEKVVSLLRNAGHATRAHRITSLEDLEESLGNQLWDLFIAKETDGEVSYKHCLDQIKSQDKDIPFVLIAEQTAEEFIVKAMKAGVRDVVPVDHSSQLVLVLKRELTDLEARRKRRSIEGHLREAEKRCNILLESSMDAIAYINEGMHVFANQAYLDLMAVEDIDEMICIPVMDVLASESTGPFKNFLKNFTDRGLDDENKESELACKIQKQDGAEVEVVINCSQATYDGEECTQLIIRPEVDPDLEEKLRKFSSEDLLTGLLNRNSFEEQLENFIEKAVNKQQFGVLLYVELDHFDDTRDEYGIKAADNILGDVASLLNKNAKDDFAIGRMGDDIFGVLAPNLDGKMGEQLAAKICKAVAEHLFEVAGKTVQMTVSIGIVRINENAPQTGELLSRALKACNHLREKPETKEGNGYYLYSSLDFDDAAGQAEDMLLALQQALDNNRFKLLFQPIISLRGEGEEHYEAFIRMLDDNNEEITPDKFLPFETHGDLAIKLDRWVILQNIKSLSSHRSKGHETRLFLNITTFTITDKSFVDWLGVALKAAKLPGNSLIFQFNEEEAIQYLKQAKTFSEGIRKLGCRVSLSRFGCALNPFNTLKHVETDYVKLDGSFTEEIQKNDAARDSLKQMVAQLQEMEQQTIVPFVENASVLSTLWQAGVNYIQGYYLQEPTTEMNYDFNEGE